MRRFLLATSAALALAACTDAAPTTPAGAAGPASRTILEPGGIQTVWNIFTSQTPASTLDTGGSAWEVGTRFFVTDSGCITGFRYWRAVGETGSVRFNLWDLAGNRLATVTDTPTGSGWKAKNLTGVVCLDLNTYYLVSANTNTKQVKTFGAFNSGPISNGPVHATAGYYGQPGGARPTTSSGSNFFVDVYFDDSWSY
jgi:hypothetical protein